MWLYPLLAEVVFGLGAAVAPKGSWLHKVHKDESRWRARQQTSSRVLWMHSASLGEFEMGRPILEAFLDCHPDWSAVCTFFSPSGKEPRAGYSRAEVYYLPVDAPSKVNAWLDAVRPNLVLFIRYDLWPNHLNGLRKRKIPVVVAAAQGKKTPWYLHSALPLMRRVFRQGVSLWGTVGETDAAAMKAYGLPSKVLGNPKFDYAAALVGTPALERFKRWKQVQNKPVLLVGSAHPADLEFLCSCPLVVSFSIWVVPHHVPARADLIAALNTLSGIQQTTDAEPSATDVLLIPEFGVLVGLYSLADAVFIGGGFGKATHNVLEATAAGRIAASGPNWQGLSENALLVEKGYLLPAANGTALDSYLQDARDGRFQAIGNEAKAWLAAQKGSTERYVKALEESVEL